ncbi:class I SAM-dependent methyltransferase [Methylocystis bryophila]|uniref:SAM-dependent methyltransferase n=1 Tax=Methylocystis bryophila TaxID=655015 RepID=A0A1W6N033_9HYPH|nr:class I SAM-dependent methyltransferase [Methylocystis bryophila]ARN83185.1 SAM-dependent methyltransferase [Methylocystis bryophila]BDV39522.1 SAM-dependent methyltransferase [Methylocystis bryophila]
MKLSSIIPWGRNFDEYRTMFALSSADLQGRVLGCGDGPASFNAEAAASGFRIISIDPLYVHTAAEIEAQVQATFDAVTSQLRAQKDQYLWERFTDPDSLGEARRTTMRRFLDDYEKGEQNGRYVAASLPQLPFSDGSFDLALSSHLLFLYSEQLPLAAHIAAVRELLRVAREVRIFPLLTLSGELSPHLQPVCAAMRGDGYDVEKRNVDYEFQRGGNVMLRLRRASETLDRAES